LNGILAGISGSLLIRGEGLIDVGNANPVNLPPVNLSLDIF